MIQTESPGAALGTRILHVGCGGDPLPSYFDGVETRLDVDPVHEPHVCASMIEMGPIGSFDAIYCAHALEHLPPHDVGKALREFLRVLAPGGYALIFVPDLEDIKPSEDVLYMSPAGSITGLDLIYGFRGLLEKMPYMAHRYGFTQSTLTATLKNAGFSKVDVKRLDCFNLMAVAVK